MTFNGGFFCGSDRETPYFKSGAFRKMGAVVLTFMKQQCAGLLVISQIGTCQAKFPSCHEGLFPSPITALEKY